MSELSGISRVQISYYETADSVPTMITFKKWLLAVTREIRKYRPNKWGRNADINIRERGWGKNARKEG